LGHLGLWSNIEEEMIILIGDCPDSIPALIPDDLFPWFHIHPKKHDPL
jgi:hypothetical protein